MHHYILTLIGPDKTGLVDILSTVIQAHGGNWLESRLSHLSGHFTGIVRIELPAGKEQGFDQALREISELNIQLYPADPKPAGERQTLEIDLLGQDRPGLVQTLTQAVARKGGNVEDFESSLESAPMSGGTLFRARLLVSINSQADIEQLQLEIERIGEDLMCEIKLDS